VNEIGGHVASIKLVRNATNVVIQIHPVLLARPTRRWNDFTIMNVTIGKMGQPAMDSSGSGKEWVADFLNKIKMKNFINWYWATSWLLKKFVPRSWWKWFIICFCSSQNTVWDMKLEHTAVSRKADNLTISAGLTGRMEDEHFRYICDKQQTVNGHCLYQIREPCSLRYFILGRIYMKSCFR
jgi:hypothetical protein